MPYAVRSVGLYCCYVIFSVILAWCNIQPKHSTTVFQKSTGLFFIFAKFRNGVTIWHILYYGDILRYSQLVSNLLCVKVWWMLEFVDGFINVSCHWYVYIFFFVIPPDSEFRIQFPLPNWMRFCIILVVIGWDALHFVFQNIWFQIH